jgi:hypothetical protein
MSEPKIRRGEFVDDTPDVLWGFNPDGSSAIRKRRNALRRRRPRSRFGRFLRWLFADGTVWMIGVGGLLGLVLVLLSTPDARAETNDSAFLAVLAADGFRYDHGDVAAVLNNGHKVCDLLAAGATPYDIVTALDAASTNLGRPEAAEFAALANAVYCPQFGIEVSRA